MIYQSLKKFYSSHWKLSTLKEHDNTSTDHSLYSLPIKFGQNFQNFIGNFAVANKVRHKLHIV